SGAGARDERERDADGDHHLHIGGDERVRTDDAAGDGERAITGCVARATSRGVVIQEALFAADRQAAMAWRIASGARLLHRFLISGIPPRESETCCLEICEASSSERPFTISVAADEQAIATAQPMHLNFASTTIPFSI